MSVLEGVVLMLIVALATGQDLCYGKISNVLIVLGVLVGICCAFLLGGDLWSRLLGVVLPVVFLYVMFAMNALGAGDIKLLSTVGCFLGVSAFGRFFVCTFVIGAVYSMAVLIIQGRLRESLSRIWIYLKNCLLQKSISKWPMKESVEIHFTVPILISVWMYLEGWI